MTEPSTLTRDRIATVARNNREMADACDRVLEVLKQHPEADVDFAKIFGIQANPLK